MARSSTSTLGAFGPRTRARLLAALGLAGLLGGMAVIVMTSDGNSSGAAPVTATTTSATTTVKKPAPSPPRVVRITVRGVGAYDPEGDRTENDSQAPLATDGNPTTGWTSEHYLTTFTKSGVGLVLDAGRTVRATSLTLTTNTPGYSAQVQVGPSPTGPFVPVSASKTTQARTSWALKPTPARYLIVWITSMPSGGVAAVDEVAVTARR